MHFYSASRGNEGQIKLSATTLIGAKRQATALLEPGCFTRQEIRLSYWVADEIGYHPEIRWRKIGIKWQEAE